MASLWKAKTSKFKPLMFLMHLMFLLYSLQTCKSSETYRGGKRLKLQISYAYVYYDDVLVFHHSPLALKDSK